jgi:hypothetical protein
MTQPTCANCRYFGNPPPSGYAPCRRYPVQADTHRTSWCGEHKPSTPIVTENLT